MFIKAILIYVASENVFLVAACLHFGRGPPPKTCESARLFWLQLVRTARKILRIRTGAYAPICRAFVLPFVWIEVAAVRSIPNLRGGGRRP